MEYRIAAVTQDGQKLSSHFGMAPSYRVYTVVDGEVHGSETRAKPHHSHHPEGAHAAHGHTDMLAPIDDCKVLLVGGMGMPAYQKALDAGLEVILTGGEIQPAIEAYLNGELTSDLRRVHSH